MKGILSKAIVLLLGLGFATASMVASAKDTDGDGIFDYQEKNMGISHTVADTDGDGLGDLAESNGIPASNTVTFKDTDGDRRIDAIESNIVDTDGDGTMNQTDPENFNPCAPNASASACTSMTDTDGDKIPNSVETSNGSNPSLTDTDTDQVPDRLEYIIGSNPNSTDTDADGETDTLAMVANTSPTVADDARDSDSDGQLDILERQDVSTGGVLADFDSDTWSNESDSENFNPCVPDVPLSTACTPDTDGDGLFDFWEKETTGTDFTNPDTDGDGVNDRVEVGGTDTISLHNPRNTSSADNPNTIDALDPCYPNVDAPTCDKDKDGLTNDQETKGPDGNTNTVADNTNPNDPDTDDDGYNDGEEVTGTDQTSTVSVPTGTSNPNDPCDPDPNNPACPAPPVADPCFAFPFFIFNLDCDWDKDRLTNGAEVINFNPTNPFDADSDDDGYNDGEEVTGVNQTSTVANPPRVSNPNDPCDPDRTNANCDTDGDGIPDGKEDKDNDRVVDPGETDPNNPDTDRDGYLDGQEVGPNPDNPLNISHADNPDVIDALDPCYPNPNSPACPRKRGLLEVYSKGSGVVSWPLFALAGAALLARRRYLTVKQR